MDDLSLQQFLSGDKSSFSILYNEHIGSLLAYGVGLGFEKQRLKDTVQEIFIKIYLHPQLLIGVQNIRLYLLRMLRNSFLDQQKSKSHLKMYELDDDKNFILRISLHDEVIEEEERLYVENTIEKMLSLLTDRQREAIFLRYMNKMEYENIAQLLDISPHSVRKLVSRAILTMRDAIQKQKS